MSTWAVLAMNYSKEKAAGDPGRGQALAPVFAGIFQAFVDALLLHAQVQMIIAS